MGCVAGVGLLDAPAGFTPELRLYTGISQNLYPFGSYLKDLRMLHGRFAFVMLLELQGAVNRLEHWAARR